MEVERPSMSSEGARSGRLGGKAEKALGVYQAVVCEEERVSVGF